MKNLVSITSPDVAAAFASYSDDVRTPLLSLRQLILRTADETAGVGEIEETQWGQPSYRTSQTRSGSTIRIAPAGSRSTYEYAMFFTCHTNLVESFKTLFGDIFNYDGERGLLFEVGKEVPTGALRQCVVMALTYQGRLARWCWLSAPRQSGAGMGNNGWAAEPLGLDCLCSGFLRCACSL